MVEQQDKNGIIPNNELITSDTCKPLWFLKKVQAIEQDRIEGQSQHCQNGSPFGFERFVQITFDMRRQYWCIFSGNMWAVRCYVGNDLQEIRKPTLEDALWEFEKEFV